MSSNVAIVVKACLADSQCRDKVLDILRKHHDTFERGHEIRGLCVELFRANRSALSKLQASVLESVLYGTHWGNAADELARHFAALDSSVSCPSAAAQPDLPPGSAVRDSKVILL